MSEGEAIFAQQCKIELPWPPSVNRYWRNNRGRTHISTEGKSYRSDVVKLAKCAKLKLGDKRLSISIDAYPPDRRRRDLDNMLKAPLDALQHAGVYDDDSQIDSLHIYRREIVKLGKLIVAIGYVEEMMKRREA